MVGLVGVLCFLAACRTILTRGTSGLPRPWILLVPGLFPFLMYALVHVETRFLGAFAVMCWPAAISIVRLPRREWARRLPKRSGC